MATKIITCGALIMCSYSPLLYRWQNEIAAYNHI